MTKIRLILVSLTIIIVGSIGIFASFYARGNRFNIEKFKFEPNGILVVKSDPTGSEIYINGDIETTSDANISLAPGTYDVSLKKDGFITWNKRLVVEKEIVTEIAVSLFKSVPSLSPVTLNGSINPVASSDYTKIVYFVPPLENQATDKTGLWIVENVNLPIGFSKDPRKITDGNLINSSWKFSPDGNDVLLETAQGIFLLNAGSFTSQGQRVNIASKYQITKNDWKKESNKKIESNLKSFPDELEKIFLENTEVIEFAPDNKKMLYIASSSASLKEGLVKPLPGTSTQKEERNIEKGRIYVYDIKEDRNFLIAENSDGFIVDGIVPANPRKRLAWFPNSNNL
ncbi:MAG: PEGA domain-containing protein, partial [Patescibacteria group bacterium]